MVEKSKGGPDVGERAGTSDDPTAARTATPWRAGAILLASSGEEFLDSPHPAAYPSHPPDGTCGNNSVVECNLAKVEVVGSNPISRSK